MVFEYVLYVIYMITAPNGGRYIGKTMSLTSRLWFHKSCKGQNRSNKLSESILKHGWDAHKVEILEEIPDDESMAYDREIYWIDYYKSNFNKWPNNRGLNLTEGGRGSSKNNDGKKGLAHKNKRATTLLLKDVPEDVRDIIIQVQGEIKIAKRIGKYSQERAIYHIIREYRTMLLDRMSTCKSEGEPSA